MNIDTIKESGDKIFLAEILIDAIMTGEISPLLWCRDGEFCLIPKEVIQNAVDLHEMSRQEDSRRLQPPVVIVWSQGIEISNLAGRALINE